MNNFSISISQLKTNPAKAIAQAADYPVAIKKREEVKALLVGKELFEKIIAYIEEYVDKNAVKETDFRKGKDFETVAQELSL